MDGDRADHPFVPVRRAVDESGTLDPVRVCRGRRTSPKATSPENHRRHFRTPAEGLIHVVPAVEEREPPLLPRANLLRSLLAEIAPTPAAGSGRGSLMAAVDEWPEGNGKPHGAFKGGRGFGDSPFAAARIATATLHKGGR